ncbi:MAG: 4-hydroxythreonine-4-phosphate dehydrogenase PdxA [Deltaproteobacteria bacterium]|nr:4-hydroxythreonine-4-phosphate dehydrogenase PdxA [Deltaproteobacteria bacterium]
MILRGVNPLNDRPVIGITMGDPAGIGPEIIAKAFEDETIYHGCRPVVLGDPGAVDQAMARKASIRIREIGQPSEALGTPGSMDVIPVCRLEKACLVPGFPRVEGGVAMVDCIIRAVDMAKKGEIAAMVTGPINKALMHEAGYPYEGHTQFIAGLTGCRDYVMMLAGERLRVALVTIHCALKDVPFLLTSERISRTIAITSRALRTDFGLERPKIGVTALNPHAGEHGLFGTEEEEIIRPAIEKAEEEGCIAEGPFPADTLFFKAAGGRFDAVVAMYHDQGLIPLKLLHFSDAVNVTLGLPIIRTSVDHGTAYDIAGKGIADPGSLKAAMKMAVNMARNRAARAEEGKR